MMRATDELAIAVLGRQMPSDLLHGRGEFNIIVGFGRDDLEGIGALVGGHMVDIPRDVGRWATITHAATCLELGALGKEAIAIGLGEQLDDGLLRTHCSREWKS